MRTGAFSGRRAARRGLTLIELIVAAGLLALLLAALFGMLDDFLRLWDKSERRRQLVEESSGVAELFAADLAALEPGPRGDLLAEWVFFDTDADGVAETKWPRIRLVRHASPADLARLQAGTAQKVLGQGLLEVIWTVLPAQRATREPERRAEGLLWRGERIVGSEGLSVFDEKFLSSSGVPAAGAVTEVTGGMLWLGMQLASPTSVLSDGWSIGREIDDCTASWDAWGKRRPNAERHVWNDPGTGLPPARGRPLLPRRARIELEFEHAKDLKRRTRLVHLATPTDGGLEVDDPSRLPAAGGHVLVDAEWMRIVSITRDGAAVERGQRGTSPAAHEVRALVHFGTPSVREVPIALVQEDWDL